MFWVRIQSILLRPDQMPAAKTNPHAERRPNLAGVINKADLFKKNGHDYVAWARVANYLHTNANGWECQMRPAMDGGHVWKAPNGTGYLVLYFTGPDGQVTADFPYAITDFRNKPISLDAIDAATFCNSQRRGFAACAAYTFSLGYELWAKEEIDAPAEPHAESSASRKTAAPVANPQQAVQGDELEARKNAAFAALMAEHKTDEGVYALWVAALKQTFPAAKTVEKPTVSWLHADDQVTWCEQWIKTYQANKKATAKA